MIMIISAVYLKKGDAMEVIINTNKFKIEFDKSELISMFKNHEANYMNYIRRGKREAFFEAIAKMLQDENFYPTYHRYEGMSPLVSMINEIIDEMIVGDEYGMIIGDKREGGEDGQSETDTPV